jgi:hypothetical protein
VGEGYMSELYDWCEEFHAAIERREDKIAEIIRAAATDKTITYDKALAEISAVLEEFITAAAKFETRLIFVWRSIVSESIAQGDLDWAQLANYVSDGGLRPRGMEGALHGGRITPQIRQCLIDILEGRHRQPRGMTKHQRMLREQDIVWDVVEARARGKKTPCKIKEGPSGKSAGT